MRRCVLVGIALAIVGLPGIAVAESVTAVGSRSAHEPGAAEERLEHEHGPRHGGQFGDAEDLFHYELLLEPGNRLVLYVNDERNQPLDVRTLQGRWALNPDEPWPVTGAFAASDDGTAFVAILPEIVLPDPLHCKVEVLKDGQWIGMEFFLPTPS